MGHFVFIPLKEAEKHTRGFYKQAKPAIMCPHGPSQGKAQRQNISDHAENDKHRYGKIRRGIFYSFCRFLFALSFKPGKKLNRRSSALRNFYKTCSLPPVYQSYHLGNNSRFHTTIFAPCCQYINKANSAIYQKTDRTDSCRNSLTVLSILTL